jgi:hypothetical protein
MPTIEYRTTNFRTQTLNIIKIANNIIDEYQAEGYDLTLRQLYYQFVARDIIPNKDSEYSKLGSIINNARLAGLIDWDAIVDRTRRITEWQNYENPAQAIDEVSQNYAIDTREGQDVYIEAWIEKEALAGVLRRVAMKVDIPYFSCRGYVSQSAMWRASQRILVKVSSLKHKRCVILHLGDHDPSGIDMTRDIQGRLDLFGCPARVERIALNMEQVEQYRPPPNPAKLTDSRCSAYMAEFGNESWELDALDPPVITDLIDEVVNQYTDHNKRKVLLGKQRKHKSKLRYLADNWKKASKSL